MMKTTKRNLRIEALEERALLSALPLGEITATAPVPVAGEVQSITLTGPLTASAGKVQLQDLNFATSQGDSTEASRPAPDLTKAGQGDFLLRPQWDRIVVRSTTPDSQADDVAVLLGNGDGSAASGGTGGFLLGTGGQGEAYWDTYRQ